MNSALFYIFGGTGDLSFKKLYPAFYALYRKQDLPEAFQMIVIGRRDQNALEMRQQIESVLVRLYPEASTHHETIRQFLGHIQYFKMNFDDPQAYDRLLTLSCELCGEEDQVGKIAYLATAPEYFEVISKHLTEKRILIRGHEGHRIVIEKPFGKDLESASHIDQALSSALMPEQIYRMDHYLGKSMIQNLMILRFSNAIFEAAWNRRFIDHVQITVAEDIGVGDRGGYYDRSGAIRDMIQSHLLQIMAFMTMNQPQSMAYDDLCDEKVKVLRQMKVANLDTDLVLGQYRATGLKPGYLAEKGVDPNSCTETFAALKMQVDNERWKGVDFFLRTGKHLRRKLAEVTIFYKNDLSFIQYPGAAQNRLTIRIQPEEGTTFHFNLMEPSNEQSIIEREMDFCQSCLLIEDSPEAYEKLIYDVIMADRTLYTRWDEVEASWRFVDQMILPCKERNGKLHPYDIGTWGPEAANQLLGPDRRWAEDIK